MPQVLRISMAGTLLIASAATMRAPCLLHRNQCRRPRASPLRPAAAGPARVDLPRPSCDPVRPRPLFAAPIGIEDDGHAANSTPSVALATRCSSREAASIIRNSTARDGLLIITCDAAGRGGGTKHDGMASVLRIRHGASLSPETAPHHAKGKEDLLDVVTRRTVPSRTSSEVAAISLGMKRALQTIPPHWRKRVLVLSDSEWALDFFVTKTPTSFGRGAVPKRRPGSRRKKRKGTTSIARGRGAVTQSMGIREEAHRRSLELLANETSDGLLFCKVRSSSRGVGSIANVGDSDTEGDASWDGIGFIDHDCADHLSSITRSSVNSNVGDLKHIPFVAAKPLGEDDMKWLEKSDEGKDTSSSDHEGEENRMGGFWRTFDVIGSEARDERQKRSQRRMEIIQGMLGRDKLL
ncbi:hypothetical protein ACHAWF_007325 [Thalassiosira exigua]